MLNTVVCFSSSSNRRMSAALAAVPDIQTVDLYQYDLGACPVAFN